jgi:hypothetical protein
VIVVQIIIVLVLCVRMLSELLAGYVLRRVSVVVSGYVCVLYQIYLQVILCVHLNSNFCVASVV